MFSNSPSEHNNNIVKTISVQNILSEENSRKSNNSNLKEDNNMINSINANDYIIGSTISIKNIENSPYNEKDIIDSHDIQDNKGTKLKKKKN